MWPVLVVFAATYALVAARRLSMLPIGRPAGALAGACAMVGLAALDPAMGLSPREAFAAVEPNTIGLLLGMMLLAAGLAEAGFFEQAASWVLARRPSPAGLLWAVALGSGALSALLVNDSVCVMLTPLVDRTARRAGLDRVPYLLALAMGANAGSAITLAGNPQNMLVAHLSGMSYRSYLLRGGVAGVLALLATAAVLHLVLRSRLSVGASVEPEMAPAAREPGGLWVSLACVAGVSIAFLCGGNLAWTALAGATALIVARGRDASRLFSEVSWTVLVFFAALFVVTAGLQKTGLPLAAMESLGRHVPEGRLAGTASLGVVLVAGSQLVSNVPLILLAEPWIRTLPDPTLAWTVTAVVSTLAGNLTLLGSVANIIVVESSGSQDRIGFRAYLRVGAPVTLVSTVVAVAWLLLASSPP